MLMLVKDIPLIRALIDLVDNSVDGARRLRPNGDYSGLWIEIKFSPEYFHISDNCGGISIETARQNAFRLGRPKDVPPTVGSVGQFGVAMKRSLFKLGNEFRIRSTTTESEFQIEQDVREWIKSPNWEFEFKTVREHQYEGEPGTTIEVSSLHEAIAESFGLQNFQRKLMEEVRVAHSLNMAKGLRISLNDEDLAYEPIEFLASEAIKPGVSSRRYSNLGPEPVNVQIFVGLSNRDLNLGGWYVFCNGRVILEADQSSATGWGAGGGKQIPKYHADFAFFRGCVFFDSEDPSLLPWTTTKTGVDSDSPLFKAVQLDMIQQMRPVLDFLRQVAKEKNLAGTHGTETPLQNAIDSASKMQFQDLPKNEAFIAPAPPKAAPRPREGQIQYSKPIAEINAAKRLLNATTYKEVGEKTFEYFLEYEGDE